MSKAKFSYEGFVETTFFSDETASGVYRQPNEKTETFFTAGTIKWTGNVPAFLLGNSWQDLQNSPMAPIMNWSYTTKFKIRGKQYFGGGDTPTSFISMEGYENGFEADKPNPQIGTAEYKVDHTTYKAQPDAYIFLDVFNHCEIASNNRCAGTAEHYTLTITMTYSLDILCQGEYLGMPLCIQLCEECTTKSCPCKEAYIDYCLPQNDVALLDPSIATSKTCQAFISNLIFNTGPDDRIDQALATYCGNKYKGFGDLFNNNPDQVDVELCACHMPNQQYENFKDQIDKDYPGLGNIINDRCLVPQCIASQYKSVQSGAVCHVPRCLIINSFNNNGTFDNSTVTVNENAPGCADITGGNITPTTRRTDAIIIGAILILIVLIILVIIISVAASKPNKK